MPFYQKRGDIPQKRHTQFRDDNDNLLWEELTSRNGFSHMYSNVYHTNPPTAIKTLKSEIKNNSHIIEKTNKHYHLKTAKMNSAGNAITSRRMLFSNEDVNISKCHANESMKTIYKNAYADELIYIRYVEGV